MKLGKKKGDVEIPTASMADIAFLLIIFFMVTTVFAATKGLDFKLSPEDDASLPPDPVPAVAIKVTGGGGVLVDGRPMNLDQILPYLRPKLERWPDKPVILYTVPEAQYGDMIAVYDVLKQAPKQIGHEVRGIAIPTYRELEEFRRLFGTEAL